MGYSVIYSTKIVDLPDGRIMHFDRSGCNNDTCGRDKWDFTARIYTVDDFIKKASSYMNNSKPSKDSDGWDMKIGSRYVTYYDYGKHLLRMLKKSIPYIQFVKQYYFDARYCCGVSLIKPEKMEMTPDEFEKYYYSNRFNSSGISWRRNMKYINTNDIEAVIDAINNKPMEFYIDSIPAYHSNASV